MRYAQSILESPFFERLDLSSEDAARAGYYRQEQQRSELLASVESKEDFFRSLHQRAEVAPVTALTLARAAQLTQKTNQFNLTTRRYSEEQLWRLGSDPACTIRTVRVRDRFGDNGIVGLAITRDEDERCIIDTFLLSCRVIGRGIETALLAHVADEACARGKAVLVGDFYRTSKNEPARSFYRDHGFAAVERDDTSERWELALDRSRIMVPEWVAVSSAEVSA